MQCKYGFLPFHWLQDITDYQDTSIEDNRDLIEGISSSNDEEDILALRQKKTLLERVMIRLRELIIASQPKGTIKLFASL